MAKKLNAFQIDIKGKKWAIYLLNKTEYERKHGDGSMAMTDFDHKTIDFRKDCVEFITVIHEIMHVFYDELCLSSASISEDDVEEIMAVFISKNNLPLLALSFEVYEKLLTMLIAYNYLNTSLFYREKLVKELVEAKEVLSGIITRSDECLRLLKSVEEKTNANRTMRKKGSRKEFSSAVSQAPRIRRKLVRP